MGRNYDDPLEFLLDGVVYGCEDVAVTDELRDQWTAWEKKCMTALRLWAAERGRVTNRGIEGVLQNEMYAYDIYQTLAGAGVGIDDGDWDKHFSQALKSRRDVREMLYSSLETFLKANLKDAFYRMEEAIQMTAMEQCEEDEDGSGRGRKREGLSSAPREGLTRLVYLTANGVFMFMFGDAPLRLHEEPMFFASRLAAVDAAKRKGLVVESDGRVRVQHHGALNGGDVLDRAAAGMRREIAKRYR